MAATAQDEVWIWLLDDLMRIEPSADEFDMDDREYFWERRTYVTDVVNSSHIPPRGAILIGYLSGDVERVRALGHVDGVAGTATARVRITVRPLLHLGSLDLAEIAAEAGRSSDRSSLVAESLRPRRLDPEDANALLAALIRLRPDVEPWLAGVSQRTEPVPGDRGQRLREERDAIQTGVELSGIELPDTPFIVPGSDVARATAMLNPAVFSDNEDDLIFADLRRFDETGTLEEVSASTSVYRDRGFELQIANVNRKPLEHRLGVDLLYWDKVADSYTLLQYKRLVRVTSNKSGTEDDDRWQYTRKGELADQLAKMSGFGTHIPISGQDWRIVSNPFWFKFVRSDAFDASDARVLRGMYVPSDYLRLGIKANSFTGPAGGFVISYSNTRYVPRGPFVELVRRGYSGSTSAASAEIARLLAALAAEQEIVVVTKAATGAA